MKEKATTMSATDSILKKIQELPIRDKIRVHTSLTDAIKSAQASLLSNVLAANPNWIICKPSDAQSIRINVPIEDKPEWKTAGAVISKAGETLNQAGLAFNIHCINTLTDTTAVVVRLIISPVPFSLMFLIEDLDDEEITAGEVATLLNEDTKPS